MLNTTENTRDLVQKTLGNAVGNALPNEQKMIELWQCSGQQLDDLHLRIFRLMSPSQQAELLEGLQ